MTVCTPHSYAGPKACPYCEVELLRMKRDNAESEVEALKMKLSELTAELERETKMAGALAKQAVNLQEQLSIAAQDVAAARRERESTRTDLATVTAQLVHAGLRRLCLCCGLAFEPHELTKAGSYSYVCLPCADRHDKAIEAL